MSAEQRETLDAILRQSAFPADSDVIEQRRQLGELLSAQPLPADVAVTTAALNGVPAAEITVDGIEPRHVVLYFHGGVYVLEEASQAAGLAAARLPGLRPDPRRRRRGAGPRRTAPGGASRQRSRRHRLAKGSST